MTNRRPALASELEITVLLKQAREEEDHAEAEAKRIAKEKESAVERTAMVLSQMQNTVTEWLVREHQVETVTCEACGKREVPKKHQLLCFRCIFVWAEESYW